jgi:hypothetical protein
MNTKSCLYTILVLLFHAVQTPAQVSIGGSIRNTKGEKMPGVSVILMTLPDSAIAAYTYSDRSGRYMLKYNGNKENLLLAVKSMTIKPLFKKIAGKSQTIDLLAEESLVSLKEVTVKGLKIWGRKDTINYLVSAFSGKNDVVIGDVLKKMPGISVGDNGSILYHGKPINKFYVENLDLLGGRYGIGTRNIAAKDVSVVQVLENHQPVKALEKISMPSTAVAINLKLKEEAKGTLSITGLLGLGATPLLREIELAGMYFAKKRQNITTYKSNNAGADLSGELNSLDGSGVSFGRTLLDASMPSPPSIKKNRYLYNNSNAVTFNHLLKTGNETQLNVNLSYLNDHEQQDTDSRTSYFLSQDSILVIDENTHGSKNTDRLEGEFKYNLNKDNNYVDNKLNIQGLWNRNRSSLALNDRIHQLLNNKMWTIADKLLWIRRAGNGKDGFELATNIGANSTPQTLLVRPGLYEDLFNAGNSYSGLLQKAGIITFNASNNLLIFSAWRIGKVYFDPSFNNSIESRRLVSDVYTITNNGSSLHNLADSMRNDLNRIRLAERVSLSIRYNTDKLSWYLFLPVNYNFLRTSNALNSKKESIHRIYFSPQFNASYQPGNKLKLKGAYSFNKQTGDIQSMYTGYILEGYRRLNHYDNTLIEIQTDGGSAGMEYKNVMDMLFASGGISYSHAKRNMFYGQTFNGILSTVTAINRPNSSKNISLNGEIGKGFDWMRISTNLKGIYSIYRSEQLRQGELINFANKNMNLTLVASLQPSSWLSVNYEGSYNQSRSAIKQGEPFDPVRILRNSLSGSFALPKGVGLGVNYEHYYNSAVQNRPSISFADIEVKYGWRKLDFSLNLNNLFNRKEYVAAYYNEINSYLYSYKIRDRNMMLKVRMKLK